MAEWLLRRGSRSWDLHLRDMSFAVEGVAVGDELSGVGRGFGGDDVSLVEI